MTQYGQHLLLARRLIEAGVSLITVYYNLMIPRLPINNQPLWDTHNRNFMYLKDHLLPSVDQPISVLLDDLHERGLLDETLVVWSSKFGRTPRLNQFGGRDHWQGQTQSYWPVVAFRGASLRRYRQAGCLSDRRCRHAGTTYRYDLFRPANQPNHAGPRPVTSAPLHCGRATSYTVVWKIRWTVNGWMAPTPGTQNGAEFFGNPDP